MSAQSGIRINKALSQAGLGSRREVERWIRDGRIEVNGEPAQLGQRLESSDSVLIDGKPFEIPQTIKRRVLIYNKPLGELCTRDDPEGRRTVFDNLPEVKDGRWISVGRLDINTGGLLIFTTDGELANRLMHPSSEIEREYAVRILGEVSDADIRKLTAGVMLEDGMASFHRVSEGGGKGANHWYRVVLAEGRQREVRRLWEALGVTVSRLMRIRFGAVTLPRDLRVGAFMELPREETDALLRGEKSAPRLRKPKRGRHKRRS